MANQEVARAIALTVALVCVVVADGLVANTPADAAVREATIGPLVSGTASYVGGTFAWTDYAYDDTGADAQGQPGTRSPDNAADLIQLQFTPTGRGLRVRAVLETLVDPKAPVLGVAFDTDSDAATGAPLLPSWRSRGSLGVDRLITIRNRRATVLRFVGGQWSKAGDARATVDAERNVVEATIPSAHLPPLKGSWRAFGIAGVSGADGTSWPEGGPIFDLAFVGGEIPTGWQDARQAAVLAGSIESAAAAARVDFDALARRMTRLASVRTPGFHTLLYRSRLRLGEGIGEATLTVPGGEAPVGEFFAGPYQPYLVHVPRRLPARPPLLLFMHGFTQNHLSNAGFFDDAPLSTGGVTIPLAGDAISHFDVPAVMVSPLGRGGNTFYIGAAEQDVLDAVDDATRRYRAETDRIVLSGASMGGFGAFRLAVRYPDRWSVVVPIIGTGASDNSVFGGVVPKPLLSSVFSPYGFPGGQAELLENVANLPMRLVNGQFDPLVNNVLSTLDVLALEGLGYDYRAWALARRHHEFDPALMNCVLANAVAARRATRPARVVFSVEPAIEKTDRASGLNLRYDRAYWVSGVRARAEVPAGEKATIVATSLARADRAPSSRRMIGAGENMSHGADLCGLNPSVRSGDAWREHGVAVEPGTPQPSSNAVDVRLSRLITARLDLAGAGLRADRPVHVHITGDGPVTLGLRGLQRGRWRVVRDGGQVSERVASSGEVVLTADMRGRHTYTLVPLP